MARPLSGLLLVAAAELPLLGLSAALYASGGSVPPFPLFMVSWLLLPAAAMLLAYQPRAAAAAGLLLAVHGAAVAVWPALLLPGLPAWGRLIAAPTLGGSALPAAAYSLALGIRLLRGGGCCGELPGAVFAAATVGVVAPVWPLARLALAPFYFALLAAADREMRYMLVSAVLLAASAVWVYEGFSLDAPVPLALRAAYAAAAAATLFMEYLLARRLGLRTAPLRLAAAAALAAYAVPALAGDEMASAAFGVAVGYVAALLAAGYAVEEMSAGRAGG